MYDGKVTTKPEMEFLGSRVRRIGHNNRKWNTWGRVYEGKLRQNRKWNSSGRAFDTVVATTTGSKIFFDTEFKTTTGNGILPGSRSRAERG